VHLLAGLQSVGVAHVLVVELEHVLAFIETDSHAQVVGGEDAADAVVV
jgi:hypothetical protein